MVGKLVHILEGLDMAALRAGKMDFKAHSNKFATKIVGESKTVQSQKDEADINNIVRAL